MSRLGRMMNPLAVWMIAILMLVLPLFSALNAAPVAAQDDATATDNNGRCEMLKPQPAFFVYNEDEDENGYNTSLPKHEPWKITVGDDVNEHTEVYHGPGEPTFSIVTKALASGDTPRTVYAYGSQWYGEVNDCRLYDVMDDVRIYDIRRDQRGHSGLVVNMMTGEVTQMIADPDERIMKVAKEDVPAYLASFNNAHEGERNLFDGMSLKWADTGEEIVLPTSGSGGNGAALNSGSCSSSAATPLNDLESTAATAPNRPMTGDKEITDGTFVIDAWSNAQNPNLSPQKKDGASEDELKYDTYSLIIPANQEGLWGEDGDLIGLKGRISWFTPGCEAQATKDYNDKPEVRRITVDGYITWANGGAWPENGATA